MVGDILEVDEIETDDGFEDFETTICRVIGLRVPMFCIEFVHICKKFFFY